jgi:Methyltransferase domain
VTARARMARWSEARLRGALERVADGTVIVTEYPAAARPRWGWDRPPHPILETRFSGERDRYRALLDDCAAHLDALRAIPRAPGANGAPAWDNDFFGGIDAVALYHFLVDRRPARYVEIGSGHSTRFARRAIADTGSPTTITSIDPAPRAEIEGLCDTVHRCALQDAPLEIFGELAAGDVVLVDGSHVAHMSSDVTVLFTEVLPRVAPGVLVGIDDVFLPWDYPATWAGRWYAEQYLLAVLLLSGDPAWRVVLPAWWVSNDAELEAAVGRFADPACTPAGTVGVTFWMERQEAAA